MPLPGSHVTLVGAHASKKNTLHPGHNNAAAAVMTAAPAQSNKYTPSVKLTSARGAEL